MSTPKTPVAASPAAEPVDVPAQAFAAEYSVRPVPAAGPVDTTADLQYPGCRSGTRRTVEGRGP